MKYYEVMRGGEERKNNKKKKKLNQRKDVLVENVGITSLGREAADALQLSP